MVITQEIREALKKAVKTAKNTYRFSLQLDNVCASTVRVWLIGGTKSISDENWSKLYPLIKPFLPDGETPTAPAKAKAPNQAIIDELVSGLNEMQRAVLIGMICEKFNLDINPAKEA